MVEIKKKIPHPDYHTKGAVEKKVTPLNARIKHTRKSSEINVSRNSKITIEKKPTKKESDYYNQVFEEEREKNEKYIKKNSKRKQKITENLI